MSLSATSDGHQQSSRTLFTRVTAPIVFMLLACVVAQTVFSMRQKSVTTDELMYIAAGYYYLKTGDFQFNMTNTPLTKLLAATPLLLLDPDLPDMETPPADLTIIQQWQYARKFIYENHVDADWMVFIARLPIVFLAVLLGLYVFRWSSELYGIRAGLFALFLFSFSPNILAHARLATQDLGLTAFMFIATYYFWRYVRRPNMQRLLLCGVLTGIAFLAKTSAMFLAPIFAALIVVCAVRKNGLGIHERLAGVGRLHPSNVRGRQLVSGMLSLIIIGVISLVVLNVGYGFQGTCRPWPLPAPFVAMMRFQQGLVSGLNEVYFAGQLHEGGLWYLTLASLFLKTPISLVLCLLVASIGLVRARRATEYELLMAIFIATMLFAFSFVVKSSVGLRYVLPIYPFLHVIASRLLRNGVTLGKVSRATIGALSVWYLFSGVGGYPHYLAYFNESIGGPKHGYKYLADSNLDWGQDLKGLADYIEQHEIENISLGFFGSADAAYYGIDYKYLPSVGLAPKEPGELWWYDITEAAPEIIPTTGIYAVSANLVASPGWMKNRFYRTYSWFREHEPSDQVGYSILIYRVE